MAAAVGVAPQMADHHHHHMSAQHLEYDYSNGISVLEDSEDGEHDSYGEHMTMEADMERYYQQHYDQQMHPEQQLQYHHYQPGEDESDLDADGYSDESSEESILPDENIDFSLIYALHTFLATVEGQASVVKGDSLLLLDDANSYWWLVRVLKTEDVGYIPAENVETPYERLARLNKHRNVDIAAPTKEEAALGETARENKLKSFIGWKSRDRNQSADDDVEEREGRRVVFAAPTFVEHPGVTWSSDEEDDMDDERPHFDDDDDHSIDNDHHMNDDGYDVEPDDGVEWAQDAVEAMRTAPGVNAPESSTDHSTGLESRETEIVTPENAPIATVTPVGDKESVSAGAIAARAGLVGLAGTGIAAAVVAAHPPPERSPSPSAPSGALARTNPTPPPHRAVMSPESDMSADTSMREIMMTPLPTNAERATTPASSDAHASPARVAPSPTPAGPPPTVSPKSVHRNPGNSIGSTSAPPAVAVDPTSPRSPITPTSPTSAIATSPGPPTGHPVIQPRRVPQWRPEAFNISRLSTIIRARADEERRTMRPARPVEIDEVQTSLYGKKLALDRLQPDIRAGYVHLQAKMDSFDREIDSLLGNLGTLVAAH